jgi:hypothetical protein
MLLVWHFMQYQLRTVCMYKVESKIKNLIVQHLNHFGAQPVPKNSGGMHGCIVPVEEVLLLDHLKPILLEILQELQLAQMVTPWG